MRVGIDARPLLHPRTGIGQYTKTLVDAFVTKPDAELFLYSNAALPEVPPGVTSRVSDSPLPGVAVAQVVFPRWAEADEIEVFWSPRHHLPLRMHAPTVVTIHDLVWLKAPETMHRFGALSERLLMPPSIRKARRIICVSESTRDDLVERYPSAAAKTSVTHLASRFAPPGSHSADPASPFILHVGTHEPRKNLRRLIESFKQATDAMQSNHSLVLAGGRGWKEDCAALIRELGLEGRVRIESKPTDARLAELYSTCTFLALPSLYEGFGLPLVEAMGFGKAVLTSNLASMPEVAGAAGLYVDPTSSKELTKALQQLMTDSALRESLAAAASAQAANFSWSKTADLTWSELLAAAAG